ncbi:hypothetical protein OAT84_01285 [Gammaproteobacteria bacterium]|nr:hypothetical protein [Gammaproteobacteria bacterium]
MNTLFFAKVLGPALCIVGLNLSLNTQVIDQYIQDVLKKPAAQVASALLLTLLGSTIIALSSQDLTLNLINTLGLLFLIGGTIKTSLSNPYCEFVKWMGAEAYVRIIGFLFSSYGFILLGSALI